MKKEYNLKVRIGEDQEKKITDYCHKAGMTKSEFIRELIDKREFENIKIFLPEEREVFSEINFSLKKVGTNINQISHFLNLEHLKGMGNFKSIEDLFVIDKLKEEKLDIIIADLNKLKKALIILNKKLVDGYVKKI